MIQLKSSSHIQPGNIFLENLCERKAFHREGKFLIHKRNKAVTEVWCRPQFVIFWAMGQMP